MTDLTTHDSLEVHDCPCCSPHSLSVHDAMVAMDLEDIEAIYRTMRYRPHHTEERYIVLVDTVNDVAVARWGGAEAQSFLDELLHGPYASQMCISLDNGDEASFMAGSLVALAASIERNLEAIARL